MSFSLLARKLACGIALAVPVVVSAQSGFAPLGGEYTIAGALPGDQVMPSASVNASGGYLVWQDNATDGDGWGISGRALDGSLSGVLAPFRVNATSKTDQENARVALLNDGGAVFVWQGGRQGFQHIYARFLSTSNTWLGLDQMVNASAKIYQANPVVAVLNNGNVVIVYACFNTNTMQDVYGQIFSPTGQKIGAEFQINTFTAYNQRTPAVAALNNGGFVVAWVSEQQRAIAGNAQQESTASQLLSLQPSVDIYARTFDAGGTPANSEFVVNTGSYVGANPVVASAADGSVMFAWSQKDKLIQNNGWDVRARSFTFSGSVPLAGTERLVNTVLYGDQFVPRLSSLGTNYMVVWTSLGQDGSAAGVYGQFLNADGSAAGTELRVSSSTLGAQQEPALTSDTYGRFLAVWTSPSYTASRNDLFARAYADGNFVPPALTTVYTSPKYVGDTAAKTDSFSSKNIPGPYVEPPTLGYPGSVFTVSSNVPTADAFELAAGTYNGLFYKLDGVSPANSGSFKITTRKDRKFTAKISSPTLGSARTVNGSLDASGKGTITLSRKSPLPALVFTFQLDLFGGDQVAGQVRGGNEWTSTLIADRQAPFNVVSTTRYTMAIPGSDDAGKSPSGSGYGAFSVTPAGVVAGSGALADKTAFSFGAGISELGVWPLYYSKGGVMTIGWVRVSPDATTTNGAVGGDLICFKASSSSASYYKSGYTNEVSVFGAEYARPLSGISDLQLSGAGLNPSLGSSVEFLSSGKLTRGANLKAFELRSDGSFKGSLSSPGLSFQGVLLEAGGGAGFFIYTNKQSGQVNLNQP